MSIYRPAGTRVWVMDFMFHGQRVRETTGMTSKTRAREVEAKRKQALRDGAAGIRKQQAPRLLSAASEEWLETKRPRWSCGMFRIAKTALQHLLPVLGKQLLVDIEAADISCYQRYESLKAPPTERLTSKLGCFDRSCASTAHGLDSKLMCRCFPNRKTWVGRSPKSLFCCSSAAGRVPVICFRSLYSLLILEPGTIRSGRCGGATLIL